MSILETLFGGGRRGLVRLEGSDDFDFEIVGESHYQSALGRIAGAKTEDGVEHYCEALLVPEPTNKYDPNAVAVTISGQVVGHLNRGLAKDFTDFIGRNRLRKCEFQCDAVVVGGWRRRGGSEGHYGVKLDLRWPPRIE